MSVKVVDKIIDQPHMPQNYYGMSLAINNNTVDLLTVLEHSFHDEMYYVTVVDANAHQFTIRYDHNARVNVKPA